MNQRNPLPHSHWRHYKSTGWTDHTYEVIGIAKHSETEEEMVLYKMLYDAHEEPGSFPHKKWALFVRPLSMWFDIIEWRGEKVQRFTEM